MELLRIIYLSLIGFGILALVVISASYITYQVRKKLGKTPSEGIRKEDRIKNVKVKFHDRNSSSVKQHHPSVVRKRYYPDDPGNPRQRSRDRITILNDLLQEDSSNYKRFSSN